MSESEYGSNYREALKRSMSKPAGWKPTNKRQHDDLDRFYAWGSAVLLLLVVLFGGVCITAQICKAVKPRPGVSHGK